MANSAEQSARLIRFQGRNLYWPNALRALSHRNFRLFWSGYLVSLVGTWMQRMAQQWLVFRLTGSALNLGIVGFASFIGVLFLSPFAGVIVDRVNKRHMVTAAQIAYMLVASTQAILTLTGVIQFWHIVILATLLGIIDAFEMPSRQALMIEVVGREDLMNAIALNASIFNVARVLGPAIAGAVVASVGEGLAFGSNAVAYLAVIFGLLAMRLTPPKISIATQNPFEDMREGLRYVRHHHITLTLIALVAAHGFLGMPYLSLLPIFAGDVFRAGPEGLGLLISSGGIGGLLGALSLAVLSDIGRRGLLVTTGMLLFALSVCVFAASISMPVSLLAIAIVGWSQVTQMATTNTLLQTHVPDHLRGRVISIYQWMHGGTYPFGSLALGAIAQQVGAPLTLFSSGFLYGILVLIGIWRMPELKKLE